MSREMKNSGIPWIGEVPKEWKVDKLQVALSEIVEKNSPIKTNYILSLTNTRGVIPYTEKGDIGNKSKENHEDYKIAYPDTIVANSMNILIGSVGICKYYGCVSPVYYIFKATDYGDLHYFNYIMSSEPFQKHLRQYANGILEIRLRVSSSDILKRYVPFPSLSEQQKIAEFLDKKCGEVDKLIALQEQIIEELKAYKQSVITEAVTKGLNPNVPMKDSGIEWIGEIPEHWEVIRIKYLLGERKERSENGEEEPLSMSQKYGLIPTKEMDMIPNMASSFEGAKIVHIQDLVFNKLKAHLGVFATSKYNGLVSPDYAVYYGLGKALMPYMEYMFKTPQYISEFRKTATGVGSGLTRLYTSDLFTMLFPLPSVVEQEHIVNFLDTKKSQIDALIAIKQQKIESLKEYKKSIIYEYVTGKKEVV